MPWMADAVSATMGTVLRAGVQAAHGVCGGFRDNFVSARQGPREGALQAPDAAFAGTWGRAGPGGAYAASNGAGLPGSLDVAFACALGVLTIGAMYRCLAPEWRALEAALASGEPAQRRWGVQTHAQLRRRTLGDTSAMRQCFAAFEATHDSRYPDPVNRRQLAEREIAQALVLHVADAPQSSLAQSDRVMALSQLLAHGLGFRLPGAWRRALRIDDDKPSLIRFDDAFTLLRERLEPDWRHDEEDSPTFSVHPVDVQLFDPAETTADLSDKTRAARLRLTDPGALRRVRSRVVRLIAASVRNDCGGVGDWRALAQSALALAAQRGLCCENVIAALGTATRSGVSARRVWHWSDEPTPRRSDGVTPALSMDTAQWIARLMLLAGMPPRREPCPPRLAALARGDTPPALVIGSLEWVHLVDGIRELGRDHWRTSYARVVAVGRQAGEARVPGGGRSD
ncbi:hypothetical protein HUS70_20110 [Pandoraea nosoerga]|uniref:Uncharacterized protein n=1 Tax=Pandoraea nosoerga TaxID=2508296 RepID=A0A5E4U7V6_9BURK|nr:hypothetical protein [Pandoraea nosoerga]MBN4667837.1 hypothetical protein [Pandoraea nosoerga]MBN4677683.1 hypothetical protein [Pandoraea nosoerga]MBN4682706.1 hypothetical protein [Pandoraea nosoerga]MBN4746905.1 hypothetical protein [Pandoraea nosoerga]VVD94954.1 hypothetical protein PNO31109_01806 [Pandoraea nosoerga]